MKHEIECIKKLITMDEMETRQIVAEENCITEQLETVKTLLGSLNLSQEKWEDLEKDWAEIFDIINHLNLSFNDIPKTITTQTAAKKAQTILSAGLGFDQIMIDGIYFQKGDGGFQEVPPPDYEIAF